MTDKVKIELFGKLKHLRKMREETEILIFQNRHLNCLSTISLNICGRLNKYTFKIKNMTPKEKAKELYRKYRGFNVETESINHVTAIQCAELCVDEIILILSATLDFEMKKSVEYYYSVRSELNAL